MRHLNKGRKLGRPSDHRRAMLRNLVTSLIEHGRITTTDARAKEMRGLLDRMVTLAKKNTLHAKRLAARTIQTRGALVRLFDEIAPGYAERHGGYTRIVKLKTRHGDSAKLSIIELMPAGAPEGKAARGPAAPTVTAAQPKTKEDFGS